MKQWKEKVATVVVGGAVVMVVYILCWFIADMIWGGK